MDDNLNYFFRQREKYKSTNKKKCIGCSKNVGTKFVIENWESKRVYKMYCGDETEPCDLNLKIEVKKNKNTYQNLLVVKQTILDLEIQISKLKNKLLFEIISEETYQDLFNKLESDYKKQNSKLNAIEKYLSSHNQQYVNKNNLLHQFIEDNKKISDPHMRKNHYLKNIYYLKDEVSNYDEIIVENDIKHFNTVKSFYLKKNIKTKI